MTDFHQHFTFRRLLRYSVSPVISMIFISVYGVVDGLFLSNFAGKEAFTAVNFILPFLLLFTSTGFMFGTGGSALIAKTLGMKEHEQANRIFSCLTWFSLLVGLGLLILAQALLRPVAELLGARGPLLDNSLLYGRIYLLGMPACIAQYEDQNLYYTAGKPKLGFWATIASGVCNIVLDALFVAGFSWGLVGAAAATILSQYLGLAIPLLYFGRPNKSLLRLTKTRFQGRAMLKICTNGSSELVNNLSYSMVSLLYNVQLLRYAGDDGVAAYGVLMYVNFLFTSVFWGYVTGAAPVISYNYGAKNSPELRSLLRKSLVIIGVCSVLMCLSAEVFALPVSMLFVGYDPELLAITVRGFLLSSFCFLFSGFAIFSSSFFTALNNGFLSAVISGLRVFAFQIPSILLLPMVWGLDGAWVSIVAADFLTALVGGILILCKQKKYQY